MTTTLTRRATLRDMGVAATSLPIASLPLTTDPLAALADARLTALADGILYCTDRLNTTEDEAEAQACWDRYDALVPELIGTAAASVAGIAAKWRVFEDWRAGGEGGIVDELADSIGADIERQTTAGGAA